MGCIGDEVIKSLDPGYICADNKQYQDLHGNKTLFCVLTRLSVAVHDNYNPRGKHADRSCLPVLRFTPDSRLRRCSKYTCFLFTLPTNLPAYLFALPMCVSPREYKGLHLVFEVLNG